MSIISGISNFFGLDIGTTAVRFVELGGRSSTRSLLNYGQTALDSKIALSDSKADQQKLASVIQQFLQDSKVSTKDVAVGIPSQRVFTTVIDVDRLPPDELNQTINLQADSLIPTPINESKIDWTVIGDSPKDKTKLEILLTSVTNSFVESRLDMLESIGLNVIAFEPDNLAIARALTAPESSTIEMIIDIGYKSTDLVILMADRPRLTRSIPTGTEAIIKSAVQNLNIDENQANQFVFKFGVNANALEGQVYNAIIGTIETLTSEIEKSIKFFSTRYQGARIEKVIVTGGASALPEFPLLLANKFNINVEIGNSWRNISVPTGKQNELAALSNHFSVACGLAERTE